VAVAAVAALGAREGGTIGMGGCVAAAAAGLLAVLAAAGGLEI
jgi:hypothetical protein